MGRPDRQARHGRSGRTTHQSPSAFGEAPRGGETLNDGDDEYADDGDPAAEPGPAGASVDFADPNAVRGSFADECEEGYDELDAAGQHEQPTSASPTTERAASGDVRPSGTNEDEWGFPKESRGMSTETKIGLALVVLLLGTFGFVVWKKMQDRTDVLASTYEQHAPEPPPVSTRTPKPTPPPTSTGHGTHAKPDDYGRTAEAPPQPAAASTEFDDWATVDPAAPPKPTAHRHDHAAPPQPGRARVSQFEDFAEFEPPREAPRHPAAGANTDFADYEFEEDLFAAEPRSAAAANATPAPRPGEPGRLEVVDLRAYGDPRVEPAAAEEVPTGFDFEPRQQTARDPRYQTQQTIPQRGVPPQAGWDDFGGPPNPRTGTATVQAKPVSQPAAADCPLDEGWGGDLAGQNYGAARGTNNPVPMPADEFCPTDPPVPQYGHPTDVVHAGPAAGGDHPAGSRVHTVQSGDTYWTISREQYGTARYFSALAQYNAQRIPNPNLVRPGMKVIVPPATVLHTRYPKLCGPGGTTHTVAHAGGDPAGFFVGTDGTPKYRIGETDTLSDIAQTHLGRASRWVQVFELNRDRLSRPDTLRVGTVLDLPRDASSVRLVHTAETYR